jgi:signal transduction histidine kinase
VLDEEGKRLLGIILKNSRNIGELIEALLQFLRLGKKAVNKEDLNMDKMVNNLLTEQESDIKNRKITIDKEGNLGTASADNYLIKQVWINLLNNAIKFTSQRENAQI